MRPAAAMALALAACLILAGPAGAKPLARAEISAPLVGHVLVQAHADDAARLAQAERLVAQARALAPLPAGGSLEIRASFAQPGVRGEDHVVAALWIAARSDDWAGAYWIDSDAGVLRPNLATLDAGGSILLVDAGRLALGAEANLTFHFLGLDGRRVDHRIERIPMLDGVPTIGRVDVGGIAATTRGEEPEALFVTPWNLMGAPVAMGMTLRAGDATLSDIAVGGCADPDAPVSEHGCRPLYILRLAPEASHLDLWHVDEEGVRVVDATYDRAQMEAGVVLRP